MKIKVQLIVCAEDSREEQVQEVAVLEKPYRQIEHLGFTLAEVKSMLKTLQQRRCHIWTRPQRQGALESRTNRNRCSHISGLMVKASSCLRALMTCALLLLINLSACKALDHVRVWRSRSDRSCHQFMYILSIV
jgi:hypothetical protein